MKARRLILNYISVFLIVVLFIFIYTAVLQSDYSRRTQEWMVDLDTGCSDAIHKLVSNKFTKEDFETITSVESMNTPRYKELQQELNELRSLNSTRYLYTAKRGDDGRLIYLIDGLDLGAEDFAYPGTYIEEEMIPYIEKALSGETIYSQEIVDTTWGHIFTACYPVRDSENPEEIVGALCMEMNMESTYAFMEETRRNTIKIACAAVAAAILLSFCIFFVQRKYRLQELEQQELLQKTADAAQAANKAKSVFLFNMSHDIRTPMNAILGYTELAGQRLDAPDLVKGYLSKIKISGQRLLSIIDNVLELSRIESGKVALEETAVKAGSVLDDCILMVQTEVNKRKQTLTVEKDIYSPYIYCDTARITEIILNIISNAIKYTQDGGRIHCSLKQLPEKEEGWVMQELSVADNGIGMSEEFQQHIYESFVRERSTTDSGIEGTGLGMGIVKKMVDLMNGTIDVKSRVGEGSTFTIRIPCRLASYEDTQPKKADAGRNKDKLQGQRILLAEDNELNAEIAVELMTSEGLLVERAANGVACIEMLEQHEAGYYNLILMDIQMPVLGGYDATRRIRKLPDFRKAKIPIIAMTANAFSEDKAEAIAAGMDDFVAKPIDMNLLLPVLDKYL